MYASCCYSINQQGDPKEYSQCMLRTELNNAMPYSWARFVHCELCHNFGTVYWNLLSSCGSSFLGGRLVHYALFIAWRNYYCNCKLIQVYFSQIILCVGGCRVVCEARQRQRFVLRSLSSLPCATTHGARFASKRVSKRVGNQPTTHTTSSKQQIDSGGLHHQFYFYLSCAAISPSNRSSKRLRHLRTTIVHSFFLPILKISKRLSSSSTSFVGSAEHQELPRVTKTQIVITLVNRCRQYNVDFCTLFKLTAN